MYSLTFVELVFHRKEQFFPAQPSGVFLCLVSLLIDNIICSIFQFFFIRFTNLLKFIVTVKPAAVLPHQALSCNNRNKTKVYDCRPLYSIGFDRTRIAWEWYCVKWDQSYQGKQQSRGVVASGRGVPQQRIERAKLVRAKRHCRQHFSLSSAKGMERSAAA